MPRNFVRVDRRQWENAIVRLQKKFLPNEIRLIRNKIALDLFSDIVKGTPVDTGRARANWQVSLGRPAGGTVEKRDITDGHKTDTDLPTTDTVQEVSQVVQDFVEAYGVVWLTNNLDYIDALENGHSGQAPVGWIFATLKSHASALKEGFSRL